MLIIASLLISGFANAESEILPPDLKVWVGYGYTYDSYGTPMICPYWESFSTNEFANTTAAISYTWGVIKTINGKKLKNIIH